MKKIYIASLFFLLLAISLASAEEYKTAKIKGYERDDAFTLNGGVLDYEKATIDMSIGSVTAGKQTPQSSLSVIITTEDKQRIQVVSDRKDIPIEWEFSENKIKIKQPTTIRHVYYKNVTTTWYDTKGKLKSRTQLKQFVDQYNTIVTYTVLPNKDKATITFNSDGLFKLTMNNLKIDFR